MQRSLYLQLGTSNIRGAVEANLKESALPEATFIIQCTVRRIYDGLLTQYRVDQTRLTNHYLESSKKGLLTAMGEFRRLGQSGFRIESLIHSSLSLIYSLLAESEASLSHAQKHVELWEANPHFVAEDPGRYRIAISNLLSKYVGFGQYPPMAILIEKLKKIPPADLEDEAAIFQHVSFFEHCYLMGSGMLSEAASLISGTIAGLKKHGSKISKARELAIWMNFAFNQFILGDFRQALKFVNRIINEERTEQRLDIQFSAKLLLMMIHFELENFDLLEHLIASTSKQFRELERIGKLEKAIVSFLKKSLGFRNRAEFDQALEKFKYSVTESDMADLPGIYHLLLLWIVSKKTKKKLAAVYREALSASLPGPSLIPDTEGFPPLLHKPQR